ncbi:TetR/AcrR family transcriptional regulator [Mycobacterium sp. OTB74]|jgi:AcrR family transcriptional regulator|uniref:TetR/AcrR family transcriptional regulator n=1 Tax=Mycobacterium sp. OTB74 TaxID=1853452 RepID=UPI002476CB1C|nr:TetR/AcrR family transcriptional regulator [Mycobacterium sp. OTB74]MDH6245766.1 AcrR family transcriptional regulator [Mycobacterium sp. OTB74]
MTRTDRRKQEMTARILDAAFELFLDQGVAATTIEQICEHADVANRTFFNHFATRQAMVQALAERRFSNLHDVVFSREEQPIPERIVGVFDDIATSLTQSSDTYREIIGEMMSTARYGAYRGSGLHETFLELVRDGMARGQVGSRHDAQTLADLMASMLSGGIANWAVDSTYDLEPNLHNAAVALADLLTPR